MQPSSDNFGFFGGLPGQTFLHAAPQGIGISQPSRFPGPGGFPIPHPPPTTLTVGFQGQGGGLPPPPLPFLMVRPPHVSNVTHTPISALPPSGNYTQLLSSTSASHGISEDERWIEVWLDQRKQQTGQSEMGSDLRIGNAAESLAKCRTLLDRLQDQLADLQRLVTMSTQEEFDSVAQHATVTWHSADAVLKRFADAGNILSLTQLVDHRQKRRESRRRRRKLRQEKLKDAEEKRMELHQKIDEWQAKKIAADISARQEAAVRSQAGGALGEVKRKVAEAEDARQLLKALSSLRTERKAVLRREGVDITEDEDRLFSQRLEKLDRLLEKQLDVYSAEERTLKVMLAEEKEEEVQRQMAKVKQSAAERRKKHREGKTDVANKAGDLDPSHVYYYQAECGIAQFLAVRQQWDTFAVLPGTPGASCIPQGCPEPSLPSSNEWKHYLAKENEQSP